MNVTANADKDYVQITSNTDWGFSGLPPWLRITPSSGHGNARLEFSFTSNGGIDKRTADIFLGGSGINNPISIKVTQTGATPFLTIDQSVLEEKGEGQQDSLVITSNVPWKIDIPAEATWIGPLSKTGMAGVTKFYFVTMANTVGKARSATIKFVSTEAILNPVQVNINQAQPDIVIQSFTSHAKVGETITIEGSGFSINTGDNHVTINGVAAVVTASTPNSLSAIVPEGTGSGNIVVTVGTKTTASTTPFTYD